MNKLERELRKLRNAEFAADLWNRRLGDLAKTIEAETSIILNRHDMALKAQGKIKERLQLDSESHYKATEEKVRTTPVGTVTLKVSHDLIIDDEKKLLDFARSKSMFDRLVKLTFDKTKLRKWCSAMQELDEEVEGIHFAVKYILAITWPKE